MANTTDSIRTQLGVLLTRLFVDIGSSRHAQAVAVVGPSGNALDPNASGALSLTQPLGGTLVDGTASVTTTAAAIGAQACVTVLVQADPDNTVDVFIGDSSNQRYQVLPGAAVGLPVTNVSQVYAKTASGTATVNWLAVN